MGKQPNMGHQHLESVDEEPHPGVLVTITPDPDTSSSDGGFDSPPEPRRRPRSSHPLTQHPIYRLHFARDSGSGSGSDSGGGGRKNSASTRGSSYTITTTNGSASSCTSDNCSHRNPCQFHSSQRKLSAVSNQSTASSSAPVTPEPVTPKPVVQPPVAKAPVVAAPIHKAPVVPAPILKAPAVPAPILKVPAIPAPIIQTPVVQAPVVQEPAPQPPVTPTPAVRPTCPRKDSHVSTYSLARVNTGCSSQKSSRLRDKPTWKSIGICAFTGLGGLLFGYDTGYINGVMAMPYFENMYLGYSVRPMVVPVTDRDGDLILDKKGMEIMGPISINALRERLPPNDVWVESKGDRGYFDWNEDGDDDDDDDDENEDEEVKKHKRNVILEAFRYGDHKPPPWIRIERHEQPYFVIPHSITTGTETKVKKDLDGKNGHQPPHPAWFRLPAKDKSLIVGLLSAGTCIGSLIGSDIADYLGRRVALMIACVVFIWGVINQTVSEHMDMLGRGRFETGLGMGMVSTVIILYMCEISPAPLRGLLVAWYQLCITLGLLMSACVNLGTMDMWNTGSFRIPISLQIAWAAILGVGLFFLPESPRWYVKMGKDDKAREALAKLRCQEPQAASVDAELSAILTRHHVEELLAPSENNTFLKSWANCFRGSWRNRGSNLRRTLLGAAVQMFQQVSGVNFIFYFGTAFFKQQRFDNVFVIVVVMSAINVLSTLASFWLVNNVRRRTLMISGALAMAFCQMVVAAAGLLRKHRSAGGGEMRRLASSEPIPAWAFWPTMTGVGAYLFFYAITWGPGAWIITGEIFPLQIRARGVGISTSTNWFSNTVIAFITPVLYDSDHWNLGAGVFVIWGSACLLAAVFSYFCVPETRGLTLEQVEFIFDVPARKSSHYIPAERVGSMSTSISGRRHSEFSTTTNRRMSTVKV